MTLAVPFAMLAVLGLGLPSTAQDPPAEVPVIGETIDVRVVNVEAVVTAKSGERVRGLTAGDFKLLVDGQEVPVEYFAEVEEGTSMTAAGAGSAAPLAPATAGEEVGRNYLIYVDDSFSLAGQRNAVLEKLERDLALLGPADRMAILAFDGTRLDVLCRWTGDARTLEDALALARQRPAQGGKMLAHQRALQADVDWVFDIAGSIATGDSDSAGQIQVSEMGEILGALSKRISPEARTQLGKTAPPAAAALRGFETPPGRKVLLLLSGGWSLSVAPRLYGPLVEAANEYGYTVYPVDTSQSDAEIVTVWDGMARATGGRVIVSAANEAFRQVVADSGSYYWLGFAPTWKANDQRHTVAVEVRRPGLAVRSRSGFSDLSRHTRTAQKAESVLLFGGARDDRRLIVQLGEPTRFGREVEVPVTIGVPVEALALTPRGKGYLAQVPLAIATEDRKGGRSDLRGIQLKVVVAAVPQAGTYARFQTTVRLSNLEQRLVFSVPDPVSGHAMWGDAQFAAKR